MSVKLILVASQTLRKPFGEEFKFSLSLKFAALALVG